MLLILTVNSCNIYTVTLMMTAYSQNLYVLLCGANDSNLQFTFIYPGNCFEVQTSNESCCILPDAPHECGNREFPDCKYTKTDFIRLMKVKIFLYHQNLKMKTSQLKRFCSSWLALTQPLHSCALPPISWLFIVMYRLDSTKKLMKHCKKMAGNSHMRQFIT